MLSTDRLAAAPGSGARQTSGSCGTEKAAPDTRLLRTLMRRRNAVDGLIADELRQPSPCAARLRQLYRTRRALLDAILFGQAGDAVA